MPDIGETVGKTVATGAKAAKGVPPYVWVIAVGGGLALAFVFNKQKNTTPDGTDTTVPTVLTYTGSGNQNQTAEETSASNTTGFLTNEAWAQAAKNLLISQGVDAAEASTAIDLYINAQALNNKQNAMISTATRMLGAPPQSLPPVTGSVQPQTTTWDTFEKTHVNYQDVNNPNASHLQGSVYTVRDGDTLDKIVLKAYNFSNATAYSNLSYAMAEVINANAKDIPDIKNLKAGTKLYIPLITSQEFPNYGNKVPLLGYKPGTTPGEFSFGAGFVPVSAAVNRPSTER